MKYKDDNERKSARRLQNRLAKQRQRANIKLKQKTPVTQSIPLSMKQSYKENIFTECAKYPFSHSITLTNNKLVSLNMHNKAVDALIEILLQNGKITNYIKTNEYTENYHSHFVVQEASPGVDFRSLLLQYWSGDGFFKIVPIHTNVHRLNAVKYCLKQINVTSNEDRMQSLVDTWSILLVQTFDSLKKAKSDIIKDYKIANGLTVNPTRNLL